MSALWTAPDASAALGLPAQTGWSATGISIDSRAVAPGDLFVALVGDNFDGHDFVEAAFAKGAVAALVSRPVNGGPLLVTPDTLAALVALGKARRTGSSAKIAAVTGSVGKTGTKEMLALVLRDQGVTHANIGNLNNHIGAPLSLARLTSDAAFAVFELGMNHPGEIEPLSRMVRPDVAIITNVEPVHLEFFADESGIADEKAAILKGLPASGVAILNRDNRHFPRLKQHADAQGLPLITFGSVDGADFRLIDCVDYQDGVAVTASARGVTLSYRIGSPGRHWAFNSVGVLAAVEALGGDVAQAAASLAGMTAPKGRGAARAIALPDGEATLIDESYNASPPAVRAAIAVLARRAPSGAGRRIFVLGDMLELGPDATALHAALAADFAANGIDQIHTVGPLSKALHDALPSAIRGRHTAVSADLAAELKAELRAGDVVTVKGSLGTKMGVIIAALTAGAA